MKEIRCLGVLCLLAWALVVTGQEIEIHEEGTVIAGAPYHPYSFYDPASNYDPTSIGTDGSTDTGGSGGSSEDIFEEQCGSSDVYVEAKILNMKGGGYTVTNPTRGLMGNNFTVYAKIHNIGSSKINDLTVTFTGPGGFKQGVSGAYKDLQTTILTSTDVSVDGNGRLLASGQLECMNVTRALEGKGGSESQDIALFHPKQRYRTAGEYLFWGNKIPVFSKDYISIVEYKFTHSYSVQVSYVGGFELSPLVAASLGLSQSYTVSEEKVLKVDKFDAINAYYEDYRKTTYLEAYRYRGDGSPGGTEATSSHVETGRKFKVKYSVLEACQ